MEWSQKLCLLTALLTWSKSIKISFNKNTQMHLRQIFNKHILVGKYFTFQLLEWGSWG